MFATTAAMDRAYSKAISNRLAEPMKLQHFVNTYIKHNGMIENPVYHIAYDPETAEVFGAWGDLVMDSTESSAKDMARELRGKYDGKTLRFAVVSKKVARVFAELTI